MSRKLLITAVIGFLVLTATFALLSARKENRQKSTGTPPHTINALPLDTAPSRFPQR